MYYVNAAISLLDKANDNFDAINDFDLFDYVKCPDYIGKPIHKINLFLFENRYQVTSFLPRISLVGIAATVSLVFCSKVMFDFDGERHFVDVYKKIPDSAKNYLSFKTAKILTIGFIGVTGSFLFCTSAAINGFALPILLPLTCIILCGKYYDSFVEGKPKVDRTFEDPADPIGVEKLNQMLSYKNEAGAIKVLSQLCEADIKGNFYRNENLLCRAVSLNMQEMIRNLSKIDGFAQFKKEALNKAINNKDLETVKTLINCFKYSSYNKYFEGDYVLSCSEIRQYFIENNLLGEPRFNIL